MPDAFHPPPREDLFVIPRRDDQYYLYAPLRRSVAVINSAAAAAVAAYLEQGESALSPPASTAIRALREGGLLGDPIPTPPLFPENYVFCPHEVTLFPTSRCNLRCRYCYADAGRKSIDMPWNVAQAAIDLVATNAGLMGLRKFGVGFHGGGEPTVAWETVVHCTEYARAKAQEKGLEVDVYAATNGLLSDAKLQFIVEHFSTANISLDGPPDVQDYNRPRAGGGGSYAQVSRSMKFFDAHRFFYGIRATITAGTAGRMAETVRWIMSQFRPGYLHLEPAWLCGRCTTTGETPPADDVFAENFLKAVEAGRELGIDVHYSGARLDVLTSKFCAAPGDGFTMLPEGIVTSCFEVSEPSDARADIFHYGRYDAATGTIVFDSQRIAALQAMSVDNLPFCGNCFCKWHCAGDCLAKVFARSGSSTHCGSSRCELNRALTTAQLERLVQGELPLAGPQQGDEHGRHAG